MGWRAKPWMGKDVREMLGFLGMTGRSHAAPWGPLGPPVLPGPRRAVLSDRPHLTNTFLFSKDLDPSRALGHIRMTVSNFTDDSSPGASSSSSSAKFQAASTTREEHKRAAAPSKSPPSRTPRLTNPPPIRPLPTYRDPDWCQKFHGPQPRHLESSPRSPSTPSTPSKREKEAREPRISAGLPHLSPTLRPGPVPWPLGDRNYPAQYRCAKAAPADGAPRGPSGEWIQDLGKPYQDLAWGGRSV